MSYQYIPKANSVDCDPLELAQLSVLPTKWLV